METVVPLKPGIVVSLGRHAHHMFANNGTRPLTLLYFALREK